jgi:four helix bundle protein
MGRIRSFRDLEVWQRAVDFSVTLYRVSESFPQSERFGLTSQMRRAAVSIASNIAEGHARSRNEYAHFLRVARGSTAELETQLEIARRIGYLSPESYADLHNQLTIIAKQLNTLSQRIRE